MENIQHLSLFSAEGCFFSVCGEEIHVTNTKKAAMLGVLSFLRTTPIVFKNKLPQCQCPNHPGRQETSLSVPPEDTDIPELIMADKLDLGKQKPTQFKT